MRVRGTSVVAIGVVFAAAGCPPPPARDAGAGDASASSRMVGPEGATLSLDGVMLTIPPGALATTQTITITRVGDAPPAPYVGYSPVYRFAPAGLAFSVPARVSFWFRGDASRVGVYWTRASDPASGFEPLASMSSGDHVSAAVTHFSDGFAGAEPVAPSDGGSMDAPAMPDGTGIDAIDAADGGNEGGIDADSAPDAPVTSDSADVVADARVCPSVMDIAPDASTSVYPFAAAGTTDLICFSCSSSIPPPVSVIARVRVTTPMQLTMWYWHNLAPFGPQSFGFASDCGGSAPACIAWNSYPSIVTRLVGPGTYTLVLCGSGGTPDTLLEPPPPPATNINCGTAQPLSWSVRYLQRRVVDATPRYYTFTPTYSGTYTVMARSDMNIGQITASVRTDCASATSEVARGSVPYVLSPTSGAGIVNAMLTGGTTYSIIASGITQGLEYEIWVQ